jgi:N-hydroxyarylamine O-acetyltransferase
MHVPSFWRRPTLIFAAIEQFANPPLSSIRAIATTIQQYPMNPQPMSLSTRYWDRLGLDPSTLDTQATGAKLAQIQEAQLRQISFDNLAQHGASGGLPVLEVNATADKILSRRRGGFCFEVNGLLAAFLEELGYHSVKRVLAYVCIGKSELDGSPMFRDQPSHIILLVKDCDDIEWFVDVGFGEPSIHPLRYDYKGVGDEALSQETPEGMQSRIRLVPEKQVVRLEWYKEGEWLTRLQWFMEEETRNRTLEEFSAALDFTLDAGSVFSQKLICCLVTREHKITMAGNRLKVTGPPRFGDASGSSPQDLTVTVFKSADEVRAVLEEKFGIPQEETVDLDLSRSLQAPGAVWVHL